MPNLLLDETRLRRVDLDKGKVAGRSLVWR